MLGVLVSTVLATQPEDDMSSNDRISHLQARHTARRRARRAAQVQAQSVGFFTRLMQLIAG
jgi:hypothetical protein